MKAMRLSSLLLAAALAACAAPDGGGTTPESVDPEAAREELAEGIRETVDQALATQRAVLEETSGLVAAPADVAVDKLEEALGSLNRALLEGRQAVSALRNQDVPGRKALMKELRESNLRVREAYEALLPNHPDPGSLPELVLEDEAGQ